jgi:hypothetical protein
MERQYLVDVDDRLRIGSTLTSAAMSEERAATRGRPFQLRAPAARGPDRDPVARSSNGRLSTDDRQCEGAVGAVR